MEKKGSFNVKISFQKSGKNSNFCKGVSPWFCSKIGIFLHSLCLGEIGQEILFADTLERKEGLL